MSHSGNIEQSIKNVDVVSVGKLNSLLGSVGLQLFVGKKLK